MKHYINTDGWFMGSFQNLNYVNPAWIEVSNPSNNDFKRPKWDFENEIFIEGTTPEELQTIQNQKKGNCQARYYQSIHSVIQVCSFTSYWQNWHFRIFIASEKRV
jgi:hypothetical protein